MKLTRLDNDAVALEVSRTEYGAIVSAIGETLEALQDWEFETRTGVTRTEMRDLRDSLFDQDPF